MFRYALGSLTVVALLAACGTPHTTVLKQPAGVATVRVTETSLRPIEVYSTEQDAESLSLNKRWGEFVIGELQSLLANKNIAENANANTAIGGRIKITFGSQALRYLVGFGAGAGSIDVTLELRDANGKNLYATNSSASLAMGLGGGDMTAVIQGAIQNAISEFGSNLPAQTVMKSNSSVATPKAPETTPLSGQSPLLETSKQGTPTKESVASVTNIKGQMALLPTLSIQGSGGMPGSSIKNTAIKAIAKELSRSSYLDLAYSYYDTDQKPKRVPDSVINEENVGDAFLAGEPHVPAMSRIGAAIGVDYVCGAIVQSTRGGGGSSPECDVSLYVVDVQRKRSFKESYPVIVSSAHNQMETVVRKFFEEFSYTYAAWKKGN